MLVDEPRKRRSARACRMVRRQLTLSLLNLAGVIALIGISSPRDDAIRTHFAELRDTARSAARQTPPLDPLRDIKRLSDHLVAGAAYPELEASGDLMLAGLSTTATVDQVD